MTAPFITTSVYKYKPYAPWMLAVYCLSLILLFFFSARMPATAVGIIATILLLLPIYAAVRPKSFFSLRSTDDRKLSIDAENLIWDGVTMPVKDVTKLNIYLFAFEDFKHREMFRMKATEFGDQNRLTFQYQEKDYDFTFFLGDFLQYRTMLQIIQAWQKSGYKVSARTAFDYAEIEREVEYFNKRR
jgi:hypothetical protein